MKKLGSSLALLALLGASHLHASEQADGFNWPYGFAAQPAVEQFDAADGLNWPYGFATATQESIEISSLDVDGINWPEGF